MSFKTFIKIVSLIIVFAFFMIYVLIPSVIYFFPLNNSSKPGDNLSYFEHFIMSVFLAPAVETLIIVFPILIFEGKKSTFFIGFVSTVIFAIIHTYSINYVCLAFIVGVFLFCAFMFFYKYFSFKVAIISVTIIHLLNNLRMLLLDYYNH